MRKEKERQEGEDQRERKREREWRDREEEVTKRRLILIHDERKEETFNQSLMSGLADVYFVRKETNDC